MRLIDSTDDVSNARPSTSPSGEMDAIGLRNSVFDDVPQFQLRLVSLESIRDA